MKKQQSQEWKRGLDRKIKLEIDDETTSDDCKDKKRTNKRRTETESVDSTNTFVMIVWHAGYDPSDWTGAAVVSY